jgi:predicted phosphoribosyltransferase
MFKDRIDAAKKLAQYLNRYNLKNAIVISIPMGGIELGYEIAESTGSDFSIIAVKSLRQQANSGVTFGAVAEDGSFFYSDLAYDLMSRSDMDEIKEKQKKELSKMAEILREGMPFPDISGKTVILVDEHAIYGYAMRVAFEMCKSRGARKVIGTTPTAEYRAAIFLKPILDEFIFLEDYEDYNSISELFEEWHELSEEEAILIWERWKMLKESKTDDKQESDLSTLQFSEDFNKDIHLEFG